MYVLVFKFNKIQLHSFDHGSNDAVTIAGMDGLMFYIHRAFPDIATIQRQKQKREAELKIQRKDIRRQSYSRNIES